MKKYLVTIENTSGFETGLDSKITKVICTGENGLYQNIKTNDVYGSSVISAIEIQESFLLKCKVCGEESSSYEEICYYDINGNSHSTEQDIENNLQNPDALVHILCSDCATSFEFK